MNCPSCGANLPDGVNFCGVCGADLRALVSDSSLAKTVMLDAPVVVEGESKPAEPDSAETQQEAEALVPEVEDASEPEEDNPVKTVPEFGSSSMVVGTVQETEETTENVAEDKGSDMSENKGQNGDAKAAQDQGNQSNGAEQPGDGGAQGGNFRETLWFMQAQDPESLEAIESIDLQARSEAYNDDGNALDTSVRQQFSLNPDGRPSKQTGQSAGPSKPGSDEVVHFEEESRNKKLLAAGLVAVIILLVGYILMK